jgi:hypothetical protein
MVSREDTTHEDTAGQKAARSVYSKQLLTLPESTTYLLSICTNTQVDITEGTTTNPLGNAVFLQGKHAKVLEARHHCQRQRDPF